MSITLRKKTTSAIACALCRGSPWSSAALIGRSVATSPMQSPRKTPPNRNIHLLAQTHTTTNSNPAKTISTIIPSFHNTTKGSPIIPSTTKLFRQSLRFHSYESYAGSSSSSTTTTTSSSSQGAGTTVDPMEVEKFSRISSEWWDPEGKFKPLHMMNPVRMAYIRKALLSVFGGDVYSTTPLKGHRILEVGCGGGLSSEALARMGASVVAVDASEMNIKIAQEHLKRDPAIKDKVQYLNTTAEDLASKYEKFDAVISLEVIEHVSDVNMFLSSLTSLVKPGGALILSTINRTPRSYLETIIGAEYILQWVPRGTHEWSKFLKPEELTLLLEKPTTTTTTTSSSSSSLQQQQQQQGGVMKVKEIIGIKFNLLRHQFEYSDDTTTNYMLFAVKVPFF